MGHAEHGYNYYIKIWAILMVLLIISIVGPTLEIFIVTMITAFGVALVKALMVAAYFMHLNIEKRYIWLLLLGALLFLGGFFIGVAPDVMNMEGTNWVHCNGYNDANRARIAQEAQMAEELHPGQGFGELTIPAERDCVPQRF